MANDTRQYDDGALHFERKLPDRTTELVRSSTDKRSTGWRRRERGGYWRQYETARAQKRRAEDAADHPSGVRDVTNQLRVTRELAGHNGADSSRSFGLGTTSSPPATEVTGKGSPRKSTGTTA